MKKNVIIIFFYIFLIESSKAELKEKIILNLKKTNNLTFNFKQKINDKSEIGYCAIEYPKKIFCSYNNVNKKIMVSNGKSLVIKNRNINQYYVYPLKKTPLILILDKGYLIKPSLFVKSLYIQNGKTAPNITSPRCVTTCRWSRRGVPAPGSDNGVVLRSGGWLARESRSNSNAESGRTGSCTGESLPPSDP